MATSSNIIRVHPRLSADACLLCGILLIGSMGCASRAPVSTSHSAFADAGVVEVIERERSASPGNSGAAPLRAASGRETFRTESTPWQFADIEGRLIRTPHFRLHTTATRTDFLHRLPVFYENALEHYTTVLGELPKPERPIETYLFQNRSQWQAKTREVLPDQAGIFNTLGRGGFTTGGVAVLYYIDYRRSRDSSDTFAIAAHEGWHQYTQTTFKHHLPIWLEEGIATYMEGFRLGPDGSPRFEPWRNRERRGALQEAVRREALIPLSELVRRSPQSFLESGKSNLLTYYAQVWALTRFLVEWEDGYYRAKLEEVLQDAAEGRLVGRLGSSSVISGRRRALAASTRSGPWLILEYFNRDFEDFEAQYLDYVRTLMERGR